MHPSTIKYDHLPSITPLSLLSTKKLDSNLVAYFAHYAHTFKCYGNYEEKDIVRI